VLEISSSLKIKLIDGVIKVGTNYQKKNIPKYLFILSTSLEIVSFAINSRVVDSFPFTLKILLIKI